MRTIICSLAFLLAASLISCDLRSGIAKQEMEKYTSTPPPTMSPTPQGTPVDPADILEVDTGQLGDTLHVNGADQRTETCKEFNRVMVNGNGNAIKISGPCRLIMINGDKNNVVSDASQEFVFNGSGNVVTYSLYANGKPPVVTDNLGDNVIEKTAPVRPKEQQKK